MGGFVAGMPIAVAADEGWPPLLVAIGAVLGLPALVLVVRAARMRLAADDQGVTVANYWSTQRIPWAEIAMLTTDLGSIVWQTGSGRLEIAVERKAGGRVLAAATTTPASELRWLVERMAPIVRLAEGHGVPTVWKDLTEAQQEAIRHQLVTLGEIAGRVGRS